ncbi:MAG: GntR family transcriptional regulator [Phycisphaerae bacterium]|nr:GntR family transcriptional regulator [Phycisphaerae bacterium]
MLNDVARHEKERSPRKRIANGIAQLIEQGDLPAGTSLPSSNEMVRIFGVAVSTLQAAMNDLVAKNLLTRRSRVGTIVNEMDSPRQDSASEDRVCVFYDMAVQTSFQRRYINAVLDSAHRRNIEVVLEKIERFEGDISEEEFKRYAQMRAVLVSPSRAALRRIDEFVQNGVRILLLNAHNIDNPHVGSVFSDQFFGSYLATRHLINLGHRRIGFLSPGAIDAHASYSYRLDGCRQALKEAGLEEPRVSSGPPRPHILRRLQQLVGDPARPNVTAILDIGVKIYLFETLSLLGFSVPDDISVISYDMVGETTEDGKSIATVEQPIEEILEKAFELIPHFDSGGFMLRLPQAFYPGDTVREISPDEA